MKASIQLHEIENADRQLDQRLSGLTPTLPLALAMLFKAISVMSQLGTSKHSIRESVERAITLYKDAKVRMPTGDELAKILGETHDAAKDRR